MDLLIARLKENMISQKGWALLRYLHLRDFIEAKAAMLSCVCVVGAGKGLAELAIAAEFPSIEFTLTDIAWEGSPRRPNYFHCMELAEKWAVYNLRFGIWDVLRPRRTKYDAIVSTEVLEHIAQHESAVRSMASHSLKYTYILAPYASKERNQDPDARERALTVHEHVVCGFDEEYFRSFAYAIDSVYGVYWTGKSSYRAILNRVNDNGPVVDQETLLRVAQSDLRMEVPVDGKCLGIKCIFKA